MLFSFFKLFSLSNQCAKADHKKTDAPVPSIPLAILITAKTNHTITKKETRDSKEYKLENKEGIFAAEKFLSLARVNPETGVFDLYNIKNNKKYIPYKDIKGANRYPIEALISGDDFFYHLLLSNSKTKDLNQNKYKETLHKIHTKSNSNLILESRPSNLAKSTKISLAVK